jgi:hypothetical protein
VSGVLFYVGFVPISDIRTAAESSLFDYFVGALLQDQRYGKA